MNWMVLILAFAVAVLIGASLASLLERSRPEWSARRRIWIAALALPAFLGFVTMFAVGCTMATGSEHGEGNRDLVSAVYAMVGAVFVLVSLAGGLVGAFATTRNTHS